MSAVNNINRLWNEYYLLYEVFYNKFTGNIAIIKNFEELIFEVFMSDMYAYSIANFEEYHNAYIETRDHIMHLIDKFDL